MTQHYDKQTTQRKGKIYRRKSEALSEFNTKLPDQPLPQPKDYEEIEY
ncbi:hypothetical protein [Metabacillus malikii]|uniref:Uncharacterized protein n=1 Tax=Metabacillus malikii TaxID=1504265 RepID=A0ABT9ZEW9_9BACI|nr:hypothetical protein [Metabacillus malikii]MDQ0230815.1 hypothetical protein [Metabacillus malikii]